MLKFYSALLVDVFPGQPQLTYSLRPIAHSMFCMLMMLTPVFITDETRNEIFQLFSRRVFSLVESLIGTCIDMKGYDYVETSYLFTKSFLNLSEHEPMSKAYLDYKQRLVESEARLSRKSEVGLGKRLPTVLSKI